MRLKFWITLICNWIYVFFKGRIDEFTEKRTANLFSNNIKHNSTTNELKRPNKRSKVARYSKKTKARRRRK